MIYIVIGCLAFVFLYIFDLNKVYFVHKNINLCFPFGVTILVASTLGILWGDYSTFEIAISLRWIFGLLALICLLLMLYCLFFALPLSKTYMDTDKLTLVDSGIYVLCRHPSAIWFSFFYIFLGLASAKIMMVWAALVWTTMNVIYVYWQDRWLLPIIISGYKEYQHQVPFLIPDSVSIRKFIATLR